MITFATHRRVSNSRAATEERTRIIIARITDGVPPKAIATELGMHETSVRNLLRREGWSPMIVSHAERESLMAARRATR